MRGSDYEGAAEGNSFRILDLAKGALAQANMHSTFADPGNEHWDFICVLNTAHAGELFLKASIAKEHPLLIFKDLFGFNDGQATEIDLENLIKKSALKNLSTPWN
ncbi:hypothetical protein [Sinorhizobium medicae]|uniref:hypothetical protein n=1 Tax=Sinorhizobium medicae TaxID=110321 RepID=UPI000488154B|nr:hypothetical protein [Sinorhizobium medicae]